MKPPAYKVGQSKIPAPEWLEANPAKIKHYGPNVLDDPRKALHYLVGESKGYANDRVKHLYGLIEGDRHHEDFSLTFFLIVYGRLEPQAEHPLQVLKEEFEKREARLVLLTIDDLLDEFLVGASRATSEINFDLHVNSGEVLHARDYCYFLANAADLFDAFKEFGWRLFDLNLRYEVKNSPINGDIIDSLKHSRSRKNFHHYNNGLIVIAKNYSLRKNDTIIRLSSPQIVNGLQTLKSIYNSVVMKEVKREELEKECFVQMKVIQTSDAGFASTVVLSTNNQNPMSARNLKANSKEQKFLRTAFTSLSPRWFYQVKENEWGSLTQEDARFFKQVIGYPALDFRPDPHKKGGRVIDNQELAKAWLAFIGFADKAGDRVTHYFAESDIYELAFTKCPTREHWIKLEKTNDFDSDRLDTLESQQGGAPQYLLAYLLWQFSKGFVPAPQHYREEGLREGITAGKIKHSGDEISSPLAEQDAYLAENSTYQTWRLMSNMKELLVEIASQVLVKKYGPLESTVCLQILQSFDVQDFLKTGEIRSIAQNAAKASDLSADAVFSRIFSLLKYVAGQYWEENRKTLTSTSRIRTVLLRRQVAFQFRLNADSCG